MWRGHLILWINMMVYKLWSIRWKGFSWRSLLFMPFERVALAWLAAELQGHQDQEAFLQLG
jgi:uncharacterized membrane protein YdjX (TVP38/TMEM64 family)